MFKVETGTMCESLGGDSDPNLCDPGKLFRCGSHRQTALIPAGSALEAGLRRMDVGGGEGRARCKELLGGEQSASLTSGEKS